MKNFLICIFICLIFTSCESSYNKDNITYYRVESFDVKIIENSYITTTRESHCGRIYLYDMVLTKNNDTINEHFVSNHKIRFIPGDSVYFWYDKWILK